MTHPDGVCHTVILYDEGQDTHTACGLPVDDLPPVEPEHDMCAACWTVIDAMRAARGRPV